MAQENDNSVEENEFKHITLTPAEAPLVTLSDVEDEVIIAGVSGKDDSPTQGVKTKTRTKKTRDEYHETTLEDLRSAKMPLSQKIVIIAAIVLIIVAIVYYILVLR